MYDKSFVKKGERLFLGTFYTNVFFTVVIGIIIQVP